MNLVVHSLGGTLTLEVYSEKVCVVASDCGPGIEDIDLAMKEGYSTAPSEIREMGFGAGVGLPNIKKNCDRLEIRSQSGGCTVFSFEVDLGIPLLQQTAEATGGSFSLISQPGQGTTGHGSFDWNHIDRPPLGNLPDTVLTLLYAVQPADLLFRYERDGVMEQMDSRHELNGLPLTYPTVIGFLKQYVQETFNPDGGTW